NPGSLLFSQDMKTLLLCLTALHAVCCSCAPGFNQESGECRGKHAGEMCIPYKDAVDVAVDKCHEILAHPVVIHSYEDEKYWNDKIGTAGVNFLLGLMCNPMTHRWEWADGSFVNYKPPKDRYSPALMQPCNDGCTWTLQKGAELPTWFIGKCNNKQPSPFDIFCTGPQRKQVPTVGCDILALICKINSYLIPAYIQLVVEIPIFQIQYEAVCDR
ncbi:hypothetical protein PENTCL1PPCAC_4679, partial [Pristionchus entomophagus]